MFFFQCFFAQLFGIPEILLFYSIPNRHAPYSAEIQMCGDEFISSRLAKG
jgi:hypothetical protein